MNLISCNIEIAANFMTLDINNFINDMSNARIISQVEPTGSRYHSIK